jgi:LacI family transcriptional regulator
LCNPSLSSVNTNAFQVGHEAAALLEGVINGRRSKPETTLIGPAGIIRRRSTDVLAFADTELSELVRHIRQRACDGLTIGQLVKRSGMSRATLDRLTGFTHDETLYRIFKRTTGQTPSEFRKAAASPR